MFLNEGTFFLIMNIFPLHLIPQHLLQFISTCNHMHKQFQVLLAIRLSNLRSKWFAVEGRFSPVSRSVTCASAPENMSIRGGQLPSSRLRETRRERHDAEDVKYNFYRNYRNNDTRERLPTWGKWGTQLCRPCSFDQCNACRFYFCWKILRRYRQTQNIPADIRQVACCFPWRAHIRHVPERDCVHPIFLCQDLRRFISHLFARHKKAFLCVTHGNPKLSTSRVWCYCGALPSIISQRIGLTRRDRGVLSISRRQPQLPPKPPFSHVAYTSTHICCACASVSQTASHKRYNVKSPTATSHSLYLLFFEKSLSRGQ